MTKPLSSLGVLCLGVAMLTAGVGCEAQDCDVETGDGEVQQGVCLKSLKRFRAANPIVGQAVWAPGAPIMINGINGDIDLVPGSGNTVVATFEPWVFRAYDTPREEALQDLAALEGIVQGDADGVSGAVFVQSRRNGTVPSTLGADITVEIPPGFDGALRVDQRNGTTDIDFSGNATGVTLKSDNGGCRVSASATATTLDLFCDNGDLSVNVPGVPVGAGTRNIHTDLGDIGLSFAGTPAGTKFVVQAFAPGGTVDTGNAASAGCTVNEAGAGSKTVLCNGGAEGDPLYKVNADSISDIALTF
jgi:hypothetical protein